jgi:phosphatidate cytidylyltransferase
MKRISPRVGTALVGIPLVLGIVYWGGWAFWTLVTLLALGGMRELQMAIKKSESYGGAPLVGPVAYASLLVVLFNAYNRQTHVLTTAWALSITVVLLLLCVLFYDSRAKISLASVALTLLATLYVSLFALLPPLRHVDNGRWFFFTLFCVWAGDTAAYYVGRAIGKHKISSLSPGKTWQGLFGGWGGAVVVGMILGAIWKIPLTHAASLAFLVGIAAALGDLVESFWKRELGIKDLGTLFPGHGGILDRCDSLLFAVLATTFFLLQSG